jgi:hypothetical protein
VNEVAKPKQTETTQRWKPMIDAQGRRVPVRTKIEFSHRTADARRILEAVPDRIVAPYALRPPTMLHYTAQAAIEQKVTALALRSQTQARDVFDLELLMRRDRDAAPSGRLEPQVLEAARNRALELPIEAFRDQVEPFLDPEVADLYRDPATWEQIREFVVARLGEMV